MRLSVRLTGTTLRLTGSRTAWTPDRSTSLPLLITETGEALATETSEQLLTEPANVQ